MTERSGRRLRRFILAPLAAAVVALACDDGAPSSPINRGSHIAARPARSAPTAESAGGAAAPPVPEDAAAGETAQPPSGEPLVDKPVRCVVIGDYGWSGPSEQRVAELVDSLRPDFVLTTGDNNYPSGAQATIDQNIGQYFSDYIFPYRGAFESSASHNRFFPALGNHDWDTDAAGPYLEYFTLPGNERYYDVALGDIHLFAVDSDPREPDGVDAQSVQARWLKAALAVSRAPFRVVTMHHPPFSSGPHGSTPALEWPFAEWGADLVVAGHDHAYERIELNGITYVVSGLGGAPPYSFGAITPGSVTRYSASYGATLLEADDVALRLSFTNVDGQVVDSTVLQARRH